MDYATFAAFTVWLFVILFAGMGVYRLLKTLAKEELVNWALLPGTVVAEIAYIIGCLLTGGEIRYAKLLPGKAESSDKTTEASPRFTVIGPTLATILALLTCMAALIATHRLLGKPVMEQFTVAEQEDKVVLAQHLPGTWDEFWTQLHDQIRLLRQTCATWKALDWLNWRTPLFVYIAACLAVRLAPTARDPRFTLAAASIIVAGIGIYGVASNKFTALMADVWPLVTYLWTTLMWLLLLVVGIHGVAFLVRVVMGKKGA